MATSSSSAGSEPLLSSGRDNRFIAFVPSGEYPPSPMTARFYPLEYRFLTRATRIRAANVRERCRPTEQLLAVKALVPGRRQLVRQALGEYVWQVPHGAMPVAKVVLVAVSRGGGHIGHAAVVRAAKSVRHCRQLVARVLCEAAADVPSRLVEVGGRRVTCPRIWRVRYRSDLHLDIGNQGKEGLSITLMIANEVLPGLLGRGRSLGWSGSVGARCGIPSAVLSSHAIPLRLTGQGGGRFGFHSFIFRGGRAGANVC